MQHLSAVWPIGGAVFVWHPTDVIDVPEKVGGPALHVNAERLGRDRDGELFSDGRRGGSPAIPRRPESRVRSMRRPGRFEDGPGRRGGPHLCVDADEHNPTVESSRRWRKRRIWEIAWPISTARPKLWMRGRCRSVSCDTTPRSFVSAPPEALWNRHRYSAMRRESWERAYEKVSNAGCRPHGGRLCRSELREHRLRQ